LARYDIVDSRSLCGSSCCGMISSCCDMISSCRGSSSQGRTDGAGSNRWRLVICSLRASLPSLLSLLSSLVAFSVRSFRVSGVIWSIPFGVNMTRSAHRWLLHRWLSVLSSFRSLPLSPSSLFNPTLALSSSLSLLMLQFVQGSSTVASSPSIKLSHAAVSV
jgi:hypothetical protein